MSIALAAVDKSIVVLEEEPKTLFVVEGNVMVLPPVASCLKTNVPYEPVAGVAEKLNVRLPPKVTLAFNPSDGFQAIVEASVNVCGVDA